MKTGACAAVAAGFSGVRSNAFWCLFWRFAAAPSWIWAFPYVNSSCVTFEARGRGPENDKHTIRLTDLDKSKVNRIYLYTRWLSLLTTYRIVPFDYIEIAKVQYRIKKRVNAISANELFAIKVQG